jgi:D-cysteine desulfhydrase
MIDFPDRLKLAQTPTPLLPLDRLSAQLGGPRIWVKRDDLTGCAASGNKIRKLEFTIARAIEQGCDTLITCGGMQSNHCRATAVLGARLGLKVHLLLKGERGESSPDGNLLLDYLAGAEVSYYPLEEYTEDIEKIFQHWQDHYQQQGKKAYSIPLGASDGTGVWGYVACASELAEDFQQHDIQPEAIFHATGSGATQAGLIAGMHLFDINTPVIGMAVSDDEQHFLNKVRSDLRDWQQTYAMDVDVETLTIQVNDSYIGPGYGTATPEIFSTIRHLAALEGLILDPVYTGKAFYGLLEEIKKGHYVQCKNIVFVHTGGLFGLIAQRVQLGFN